MPIGANFETVLQAAQSGADWAFSTLYDEFNPRLVRYFAARTPGEAEDLAADTWMGVARRLTAFQGDENGFRSWLFTVAHRRMSDHWEARKKSVHDVVEPRAMEDYAGGDDPESTVLDAMSAQGAARRIALLLNPDQAEVVLLRLLGDLDVDQVAAVVGKRPGTIRVLQHRALKKLVKEMSFEEVTE